MTPVESKSELCRRSSENVEWYSRITGYYQSVGKNGGVAGWNAAKKQELLDRYRIGGERLYG